MPASRVTSDHPAVLMTRMISSEYRITSHSTTWMARIAVHTETCVVTLSAFFTARMTETIAPDPAQRHAQRYERDVDVLGLLRLVRLAGEQVERDQQEQQPARDHQGGHGDVQVVEDLVPEEPEARR